MIARTAWTAVELMAEEFPEPRWAVDGLLAEGANVLAGPPKVGKSWLGLGLAVAIAAGDKALGKVDVTAGDVLYLALEDTGRRLQSRLRKVLAGSPASDRLTFAVACERISSGGADRITSWLDQHPDARLVVVDVLARVRDRAGGDLSMYEADYLAVQQLKDIADGYGVCVLIVHHTRKAAAEDFVDMVSGSNGIGGAADAILVLTRSRSDADAVLKVTGRDVDETEYALRFDRDLGAWLLLADAPGDLELGDTRRSIMQYLREQDAATPKQLAEELGIDHELAKKTCRRMVTDEQLDTDGRGTYFIPVTLSPESPESPSLSVVGDSGDARDTSDEEADA